MFVGVAGGLKEDIPIGSVVIGDYVYNGHSAKVEDAETLGRPHGLPPARELLTAAQGLIYSDEWRDLIRALEWSCQTGRTTRAIFHPWQSQRASFQVRKLSLVGSRRVTLGFVLTSVIVALSKWKVGA
jgi:nucleoside phosphorylase